MSKQPSLNELQLYIALNVGLHPTLDFEYINALEHLVRQGRLSYRPEHILQAYSDLAMIKYG
jgi:hypothetical protein